MGFKGFSAFVKKKKKYYSDIKLRASTLVVDGNNIASVLYRQASKTNFMYNGDYDKYAKSVHSFFSKLLDLQMKLFVVLDGGFELRKLNAIQARLLHSTRDISRLRKEKNSDPFLPLLIMEVFKEVLQSMEINFAQSRYEADADIVAIAKFFNCPILSSDSDYYFSDAKFIPFTSLSFPISCGSGEKGHATCKLFLIDSFLSDYGGLPDRSFLPLLALLLGDYMEIKHFKKLYLSLLDEEERKGFKLTDYDQILKMLFVWFWRLESFEAAALKIEESVPLQFKRFVKKQLQHISINLRDSTPNPILEFFCGANQSSCESEDLCSRFSSLILDNSPGKTKECNTPELISCLSPSGKSMELPIWFLNMELRGLFSRHVSNIINLRTVLLWTQLESFDLPSVHVISFPILRIIAGILLSNSKRKKSAPLTCYVRSRTGCDVTSESMVPLYPSDSFLFNKLPHLPLKSRKLILFNALKTPSFNDESIPPEWTVYFLILIFLRKSSKLSESQKLTYVGAFILSFLLLTLNDADVTFPDGAELQISNRQDHAGMIDTEKNECAQETTSAPNITAHPPSNSHTSKLLERLWQEAKNLPHLQVNAGEIIKKILSYEAPQKVIDRLITHYYAELQSVFQFVTILNSILNFPYPQPMISKSLSGSLMYQLVIMIEKASSLSDFIDSLHVDSKIRDLFFVSVKFVESSSSCSATNANLCNKS